MELQLLWWNYIDEFVQIFNSNDNHWVIICAVNCAPGELQVYDSLYRRVSEDIKELVDTLIYDHTAIHQAHDGDAEHSQVCFCPILMILLFY